MRVTVECWEILGHRREALNRHDASPHPMVTQCTPFRLLPMRPSSAGRSPRGALQCETPAQNIIGSSICCKPLFFNQSTQSKAFVAPGRDLIAFLFVCGDAADIRHEYSRFPRDVGADVPRVRQGIEGAISNLVVVLHPSILGILLGLDAREPMIPQVLQAIRDPIDMLLACQYHLTFDARALRASDHK